MSRENVEHDLKNRLKTEGNVSDELNKILNILQADTTFEKDYLSLIKNTFHGNHNDIPNYNDLITKLEIWFNKIM